MTTYDGLRYGHATIADLDRLTTYNHVTRFRVWATAERLYLDGGDGQEPETGWLDGFWGMGSADMWRDLYDSRNYVSPLVEVTMGDVDPDLEGYETFTAAILTEWDDLTRRLSLESGGHGTYYGPDDVSGPSDNFTQKFALHVEITGAFNPAASIRNMTDPVTIIDLPTT